MKEPEDTIVPDRDSDNKENVITKARTSVPKSRGKKKASPVKKAEREILLEQLEEVQVSELKELIGDVRKRFPNHPRVWLKDVQSYLQMKIKVKETDPGLSIYECGYPLNMMDTSANDFLASLYRDIPESEMTTFYLECLENFAKDVRSGSAGYHHRILLQSISGACPKTIHSRAVTTKLQNLLHDSVTRTRECIAILWCIQMTPRNKLDTKLKVWFTWMLPILQTKKTERPTQEYICKCLEDIIGEIANSREEVELTPSDFFGYFDLAFTINSNLFPGVQVTLLELLDAVKELAFCSEPSKRLRSFFPSFLIRLQQIGQMQKGIVLNYLLECLEQDSQCWALWQQMFTKHMSNSVMLLEHIYANWNSVIKAVNKTALKQTLEYLVVTLTPSNGKSKVKESQKRALELCTDMLHAIGSPLKSALKLALLVMIVVCAIFVLHDVKEFGSFSASRTGHIYTSVVQEEHVSKALAQINDWSQVAHKTGMAHAPLLMEYMYAVYNSVWSTLQLIFQMVQEYCLYLHQNKHIILEQMRAGAVDAGNRTYSLLTSLTSPANVAWLEDSALQLMVSGREYSALAVEYSSQAAKTGAVYAGLAAQAGEEYWTLSKTYVVQNFIEEPVTVERLKEWLLTASVWLQDTSLYCYNKVTTFVQ